MYRARRPFEPGRLYELVHDKFVILEPQEEEDEDGEDDGSEAEADDESEQEEDDDEEPTANNEASDMESLGSPPLKGRKDSADDSSSSRLSSTTEQTSLDSDAEGPPAAKDYHELDLPTRVANKKAHPVFKPLLRSKGFIWLASRPFVSGDWSQAGAMLTVSGGLNWFAVTPEEQWGAPGEDITALIRKDFEGEWGDRRQEIVFIGESINPKELKALFDACLLDDGEMARWEKIMRKGVEDEVKERRLAKVFDDGWEDWPNPLLEEEEDHEHDHHGHGHGYVGHRR